MPTPTSSTSSVYHTPLNVAESTAQSIEDRLSGLDAAILTRQNNASTETSRATGAEAAELARAIAAEATLSTAVANEAAGRTVADTAEASARALADAIEGSARTAADTTEATQRAASVVALQTQIAAVVATASTSGSPIQTTLSRLAGAAAIATIGGNGTTTTVLCTAAHGYTTGDIVQVAGTTNYNGTSTTITVTSTTQFTYLSAVNAATELTGTVATKVLTVASISGFSAGQQITLTNAAGSLHATTVSGAPSGSSITLAAAVPTTWLPGGNQAAIGAPVGSTLEEVRLARTALGSDGTLTLPLALKWAAGSIQSVRAFGAKGDGATDDRAAIQAAIDSGAGSTTHKTVYVPPGDYMLGSSAGSARSASTLIISTNNVLILAARGARFLTQNGSYNRALLIRNATGVVLDGLTLLYNRADLATQTGIQIENSSQVTIANCTVDGFPFYGIGITEDTSAASLAGSTFSFTSGTKRIADSSNQFVGGASGYQVGNTVTVVNSISNDGIYTIAAVDAGGAYIQVNESLVTEAAGASSVAVVATTISFNAADKTIRAPESGLLRLGRDGSFTVSGSVFNNQTFTINEIDPDGTTVSVNETVVTEAAGATVTLTKVGRQSIAVQRATQCNDIIIRGCTIQNIGTIGIEGFPKVRSRNLLITENTFYNCGGKSGAGMAIKAGQATVNTIISNNIIAHCPHGIAITNWETLLCTANQITNCYAFGIAVTSGNHPKYQAKFQSLTVSENQLTYVDDYISGTLFDPTATNTIDSTRRVFSGVYGAINVNGLLNAINGTAQTPGPIDIVRNTIYRWSRGLTVYKSLMPITNLAWRHNRIVDGGVSQVNPLTATARCTSGSNLLTSVVTGGVASTIGWYVGIPIVGDPTYIPAGTTVTAINHATQTITMSANALATDPGAPGIGVTTAYPVAMEVIGNTWFDSRSNSTATIVICSPGANVVGNTITGYGPYALQLKGDGSRVANNIFARINQISSGSRSPILLNERGTYYVADNYLDVGATAATGFAAFIVAGVVASGSAGIGGTISAALRNNHATLNTVQGQSGITLASSPPVSTEAGLRVMYDSVAPTAGAWLRGETVINTAPTLVLNIEKWVCVTSGSPGTWRAVGMGQGTTANRPTPTAQDGGYQYYSTDGVSRSYWDGSAWRAV